jgi:predicted RNase H-like HicB family nuclease
MLKYKKAPFMLDGLLLPRSLGIGSLPECPWMEEKGFKARGDFQPRCAGQIRTVRWIRRENLMKLKVIVHKAQEGGYWAEVPAIPGCATQGETFEELLKNLYEAVEGCLSVEVEPSTLDPDSEILDIAV